MCFVPDGVKFALPALLWRGVRSLPNSTADRDYAHPRRQTPMRKLRLISVVDEPGPRSRRGSPLAGNAVCKPVPAPVEYSPRRSVRCADREAPRRSGGRWEG